jgi:hypothetical protein
MKHPLEAAYIATTYTAVTPEGFLALRIGESNAALDTLLTTGGVATWAYVTAYNPGSVQVSDEENEAHQRQLREAVQECGYIFYEGAGIGQNWPGEPSLLILGMTETEAVALGERFGQLAIVLGKLGGSARLRWLERR